MHEQEQEILKTLQALERFIDQTNRDYWNANRTPPICEEQREMIAKLRDKLERHRFWRSL